MSNQCPASEPAQNKASKPQLDDMDVMDVKTDHVSDPEDEGEW
jgi:hypothetical protein